jgi:excisionase family DNA binding protein
MADTSEFLTVAETARALQRSTEQVRRYLREGTLPGQRLGGQWFIAHADVESFKLSIAAPSFLRRLTASDPDPLGGVIGIGASGGADIASGRTAYLRAFAKDDQS